MKMHKKGRGGGGWSGRGGSWSGHVGQGGCE